MADTKLNIALSDATQDITTSLSENGNSSFNRAVDEKVASGNDTVVGSDNFASLNVTASNNLSMTRSDNADIATESHIVERLRAGSDNSFTASDSVDATADLLNSDNVVGASNSFDGVEADVAGIAGIKVGGLDVDVSSSSSSLTVSETVERAGNESFNDAYAGVLDSGNAVKADSGNEATETVLKSGNTEMIDSANLADASYLDLDTASVLDSYNVDDLTSSLTESYKGVNSGNDLGLHNADASFDGGGVLGEGGDFWIG